MIEECGKCGGHTIVPAIDYIAGVRQNHRKCLCGSRDIKMVSKPQSAPADERSSINDQFDNLRKLPISVCRESGLTEKEETVSTKKLCKIEGCDKWGSFDFMCAGHFKEVHGINYAEYCTRRKNGETKEQILGSPGGAMPRLLKTDKPGVVSSERCSTNSKSPDKTDSERGGAIYVYFTNHADLLEKLDAMAKADFRTKDQQILYLIAQADKIISMAGEKD